MQKYSCLSIEDIKATLKLIDTENEKGCAVLVHCADSRASSAVVAAAYLLRKYRYEVADALQDTRELLVEGENAIQTKVLKEKLFEYHMQILQNGFPDPGEQGLGGFKSLWFPETPYDKSFDRIYKPWVKDVNNLWELK